MNILNKNEGKQIIIDSLKKKNLIPVIGSGFSSEVKTRDGKVPTINDFKVFIISLFPDEKGFTETQKEKLKQKNFTKLAQLCVTENLLTTNNFYKYLQRNFTNAILDTSVYSEKIKSVFLSINWPYIYTFNYDDTIEQSSEYKNILIANREPRENILNEQKCTIKLHRDAREMANYTDSYKLIATIDYLNAIQQNYPLYKRLQTDFA